MNSRHSISSAPGRRSMAHHLPSSREGGESGRSDAKTVRWALEVSEDASPSRSVTTASPYIRPPGTPRERVSSALHASTRPCTAMAPRTSPPQPTPRPTTASAHLIRLPTSTPRPRSRPPTASGDSSSAVSSPLLPIRRPSTAATECSVLSCQTDGTGRPLTAGRRQGYQSEAVYFEVKLREALAQCPLNEGNPSPTHTAVCLQMLHDLSASLPNEWSEALALLWTEIRDCIYSPVHTAPLVQEEEGPERVPYHDLVDHLGRETLRLKGLGEGDRVREAKWHEREAELIREIRGLREELHRMHRELATTKRELEAALASSHVIQKDTDAQIERLQHDVSSLTRDLLVEQTQTKDIRCENERLLAYRDNLESLTREYSRRVEMSLALQDQQSSGDSLGRAHTLAEATKLEEQLVRLVSQRVFEYDNLCLAAEMDEERNVALKDMANTISGIQQELGMLRRHILEEVDLEEIEGDKTEKQDDHELRNYSHRRPTDSMGMNAEGSEIFEGAVVPAHPLWEGYAQRWLRLPRFPLSMGVGRIVDMITEVYHAKLAMEHDHPSGVQNSLCLLAEFWFDVFLPDRYGPRKDVRAIVAAGALATIEEGCVIHPEVAIFAQCMQNEASDALWQCALALKTLSRNFDFTADSPHQADRLFRFIYPDHPEEDLSRLATRFHDQHGEREFAVRDVVTFLLWQLVDRQELHYTTALQRLRWGGGGETGMVTGLRLVRFQEIVHTLTPSIHRTIITRSFRNTQETLPLSSKSDGVVPVERLALVVAFFHLATIITRIKGKGNVFLFL